MKPVIFVTTNDVKFNIASSAAEEVDVKLERRSVEVDEIQGEDPEKVALDKASKIFEKVKQPLIISDDSWSFTALRGFPGVYMKSVNHWFKAEDFLRLVDGGSREVFLTQILVYHDGSSHKLFSARTKGRILNEPRGTAPQSPNWEVTSMEGDDGLSIAEVYEKKDLGRREVSRVWYDFFDWYKGGQPGSL